MERWTLGDEGPDHRRRDIRMDGRGGVGGGRKKWEGRRGRDKRHTDKGERVNKKRVKRREERKRRRNKERSRDKERMTEKDP